MNKSPEEYFREQSLVPSPTEKSGSFSEAELAFMRKYMGLDATEMLHRIGIETLQEEAAPSPPAPLKTEEETFTPKSGKIVPPGLEQLAPTTEARQVMTKFVESLQSSPSPQTGPAGEEDVFVPKSGKIVPPGLEQLAPTTEARQVMTKFVEALQASPAPSSLPPIGEEAAEPELQAERPGTPPEREKDAQLQSEAAEETEPGLSKAAQALVEAASALTEAASAWAGAAEKGAPPRLPAEEIPPAPPVAPEPAPPSIPPAERIRKEEAKAAEAPPEKPAPAPAPVSPRLAAPPPPASAPLPSEADRISSLRPLTGQEEDLHAEMSEDRDLESIMRAEAELQMVGFYLGAQEFTVPIIAVQEVIRYQEPAKLPASPEFVAGVINLRGKMTPLVYLRDMLEIRQERKTDDRFIIVCRRRGLQFGLIIERVHTMYRVPQKDIDWGIEAHLGINVDLISGLLKLDDSLVAIVSVDRVVDYVLEK
ncbi:MAG: chemotaxis protein CheW [Deltaproteobacteria bacterium]|jgi:purine-binding chemotaxis protein CheW|nr:chemotaxis protein CheW [Deltaproteobacteria bacterium]